MVLRNRRAARQRTERVVCAAVLEHLLVDAWPAAHAVAAAYPRTVVLFPVLALCLDEFGPQYLGFSDKDFDIESIERPFKPAHILPAAYDENVVEDIPAVKTRAQLRATTERLRSLIEQPFADAG